MRILFILFCFLLLPLSVFSEELSEASKQRLLDYKNAVEANDPGRVKETWSALDKDYAAISYMNENAPNLADHYYQRRGIEAMNSVHQAQAKRGEIVPFSEIENMPNRPPPPDRGPVPVSGDPALADLADPSVKHVAGPTGDPELAALVKQSQAVQARQQASTKGGTPSVRDTTPAGGAVPKANTNFSSGNSPTPGNTRASVPKPLTPPVDHGPVSVSGDPELANLADPSRTHVQGPPRGDPELAALVQGKKPKTPTAPIQPPAVAPIKPPPAPHEPYAAVPKKEPTFKVPGGGASIGGQVRDGLSTGGNVVDGMQAAGQAASAIHKERQAAAQDGRGVSARNAAENVVGEALGQSAYDAGKENSKAAIAKAKKEGRPWWSAIGDSLKKTGEDMAGFTGSKKVNEEEAWKEAEAARAAGRKPNLGVTGAKGRAAVRVAGDATGMNPIFDAVTYDPEADRAAADMQRGLQQKVKDELQGALDETGMFERGMTRFKGRENLGDPAIRARLRELQSEYEAARQRAQTINNRNRGKLDEDDPELIALRQAVDLLPENPADIDMNEKMPPTKEELLAAHNCSGIANSRVAWNDAANAPDCPCIDGYQYGLTGTACVPSRETAVRSLDCSSVTGGIAIWNESTQKATCGCPGDLKMNAAGTACESDREAQVRQWDCSRVHNSYAKWNEQMGSPWCQCIDGYEVPAGSKSCEPTRQTQVANANCSHIYGATAYWDNNVQGPMCGCPSGYVIVNNACVPAQPVYQQPPPFDPSALINIINQGRARQNPPPQRRTPTPSSSGGSMGWVNQGYQVPNSGGSNSPGVTTTNSGGACVTVYDCR